jgi:hypothetical protein
MQIQVEVPCGNFMANTAKDALQVIAEKLSVQQLTQLASLTAKLTPDQTAKLLNKMAAKNEFELGMMFTLL